MAFDNTVLGTAADDALDDFHLVGSTLIRALGGNDTIVSLGSLTRIEAGDGDDRILISGGTVLDGAGNDIIEANATSKLIVRNGAGDDYFTTFASSGAAAEIQIVDGEGSDTYVVSSQGFPLFVYADIADPNGNDSFSALGCSEAVISYARTTLGVTIDLQGAAFGAEIGNDRVIGFTKAIGGSGNDSMYAAIGGSTLVGGAGDDLLFGTHGDDVLRGGDGNDLIIDKGGTADINSGSGDNNVIVSALGGRIVLGDGANVVDITDDTVVANGTFRVVLNSLNNFIDGTDASETIVVTGDGMALIDIKQNGTIVSSHNLNSFNGDMVSTNETVVLKAAGDYTVDLASDQYLGIDRVVTGLGSQWFIGNAASYNAFEAGAGDDFIFAHADVTDVNAGSGNDEIGCYGAFASVIAGAGNDLVHGGDGTSVIDLGNGLNRVFCGAGAEIIHFDTDTSDIRGRATNHVFDFTIGIDKIQLEAGADIAAFLATGVETAISDMTGVRFDTISGDTLFIKDVTLAQLSAGDFLA